MPFVFWAFGLAFTLFGVGAVETFPKNSAEESIGYLGIGLGLLFMIWCGRAQRD